MSCSCIKKHFDIHVSNRGCNTIVLEDQSDWMSKEAYDNPSGLELKVYLPSKKKEYVISFDTQKRNLYTSIELFGSTDKQCLPDDIYCFSIENCGLVYKISRAFTCKAECKLDEMTSKAKTAGDFEEILHIKSLLETVKINAKLGKQDQATELLKMVNKKLKHLTCASC